MRFARLRFTDRPYLILLGTLAISASGYLALNRYAHRAAVHQVEERQRLKAAYFSRPEVMELADRMPKEIFSERGIAIIMGATRVETFRIVETNNRRSTAQDGVEEIDGFSITARGLERGRGFASKLAGRLLDGRIYCFIDPFCLPDPGVAFRLWMGKDSVDLIVCYECYHVSVFVHDASGSLVHRGGDFFAGPMEGPDVMPELAKEAFPSDPVIQSLKVVSGGLSARAYRTTP